MRKLMSSVGSRALRSPRSLRLPAPRYGVCHGYRRAFISSHRPLQQASPTGTPPPRQDDRTTHFGFENVAESQKASRVGAVFSSVAASYDTMNDFMSLYIHRLWKDHFVRSLNPGIPSSAPSMPPSPSGQKLLDVAGGTGDIALRLLDHATHINLDSRTSVIVSDINPAMLTEGRRRLTSTPYHDAGRISFLEANAEDLHSVESNSIDLYTVAFGIRNFTRKEAALREAFRVLKPGGVFACLEFAPQLRNPLLNAVYKRWSFSAIPMIGQLVAADRDSYQYLVESIERFPRQEEFCNMIREAGFLIPGLSRTEDGHGVGTTRHGWEDLSAGIAAIHKGIKPV